jgi:hypothetical protein
VKRIAAHNLVQNGRNLQALATAVVAAPHNNLDSADAELFLTHFRQMRHDCESLGFVATSDFLKWVIQDFSTNAHTYDQARSTVHNISAVYQQELSREYFCYIESDKAKYMRSFDESIANPPFGEKASQSFPSALREITLAGNCYACGYNDAAIFHLMRVLEKGLSSMAIVFGESFTYENWHNVIERLESRIKRIDPAFGDDWREKRQFYSEAATEFRFFKDAWRNHVMHGRDTYDPDRAKNIYDHA